jgi:DNA polymerase-3 subunit epsilon
MMSFSLKNLLHFLLPVKKIPLSIEDDAVVLDTETAGLAEDSPILSFAGIIVEKGELKLKKSLSVFIYRDQDKRKPESVAIHGLTNEWLKANGINEKTAIEMIHAFIGKKIPVGHHIPFDLSVLNHHFSRYGLEPLPVHKYICTGETAKRLEKPNPEMLPSYELEKLCTRYNIPIHARHTAVGDTLSTALLWLKLRKELIKRKIVLTYTV